MSDPQQPEPARTPEEGFEGLLVHALERLEAEGHGGVVRLLGEHPQHAVRLLRQLHLLHRLGLLTGFGLRRHRPQPPAGSASREPAGGDPPDGAPAPGRRVTAEPTSTSEEQP